MFSTRSGAAKLSLAVVSGLVALKIAVGIITGSISVLAQAADSTLDVLAVGLTSFAVIVADRPADREHPFGHGKVENIAAMRTVADEVLRLIPRNRAWARSYTIIHNLARNPRTPVPTVVGILGRIRTKDLQHLAQNRNVSEGVRRQAMRLSQTRAGQ